MDDSDRRLTVVTEENADTLLRKDVIGILSAEDRRRREALLVGSDNPLRIEGDEVGEYSIDGCKTRHTHVQASRTSRLLTCRDCGANVDPMAWIFNSAEPVERMLASERIVRHEVDRLHKTLGDMKAKYNRLRASITRECERAAKIGLAIEGARRRRRWYWSRDRIMTDANLSEALKFVESHGGAVQIVDAKGIVVGYVTAPDLGVTP